VPRSRKIVFFFHLSQAPIATAPLGILAVATPLITRRLPDRSSSDSTINAGL